VVTPVWNARATLEATVASVQAQTRDDWEMWLVDDGSTDGSRALAQALAARDPRLNVLGWAGNRGPAAARNAGIRAARAPRIAFLDADDLWRPAKLARQLAFMDAHGHAFVFCAYARIGADGRPRGVVPAPARVTRARALRGNPIGCLTAVYDAGILGKVEMPDLPRRQDYALWLRLLARVPAHGLGEVLADYRLRPGSLSADKRVAARATWAVLRAEGLSRPRAGYYFLHYAARALARRL
jgi:glycosyltransferase involved in cell wall biosynthesis